MDYFHQILPNGASNQKAYVQPISLADACNYYKLNDVQKEIVSSKFS